MFHEFTSVGAPLRGLNEHPGGFPLLKILSPSTTCAPPAFHIRNFLLELHLLRVVRMTTPWT